MEELYKIGINENTIKNMLELVPNISEMNEKEIIEKKNLTDIQFFISENQ